MILKMMLLVLKCYYRGQILNMKNFLFSLMPIISLLGAIFVVSLGLLVFLKNKKSTLNKIFFLLNLAVGIWLFGTFEMLTTSSDVQAIFWDRFIYAGVVFVPALMYHFSLIFTKISIKKSLIVLAYTLSFFFLIISRTDYFVKSLFKYSWGVHTQAQFFHHIFMVYFFLYLILTIINFYKHYKDKNLIGMEKTRAKYVFLAFFILITVGSTGFAPAYKIDIFPLSFFSGIFFSILLYYAITRFTLFDIKVILTQALVFAIWILIFSEFFFVDTTLSKFLVVSTLIFSIISGWFLMRSVLKEIRSREQVASLAMRLQQANMELKKLDQAKSEFISIASHQLRTPLAAISGYTSLMLEGTYGKINDKAQEILKKIIDVNKGLINMVNDLLNLSRIESGKITYDFKPSSLINLTEKTVNELENLAHTKNLQLLWSRPNFAPLVMLDEDKIQNVLMNLIDNAIKYTPQGKVEISISQKENDLVLCIKDSGIGISPETLGRLFKKFVRSEESRHINANGTGLGLYIAKNIIEAHHGKIWAESEGVGKGSCFFVSLPISENDR
jgi:signal transduction histidine kinase